MLGGYMWKKPVAKPKPVAAPVASSPKVVPPPVVATRASSLKTTMIPGCCGLKTVHVLACLGKTDSISEKDAEGFDKLVEKGTAMAGDWNTYGKAPETVAILTTSNRYHHNDPEMKEYNRQVEFLKKRNWTCLASWESKESGGTNYLWGSPGIKAGEVDCSTKKQ